MTSAARERVLALYVDAGEARPHTALLVDVDRDLYAALVAAGAEVAVRHPEVSGRPYGPEDMWFGTMPEVYRLVALERRAPEGDLFRVLSILSRLVAPGGVLVIACPTNAELDHVYQRATEVLLSVSPDFSRVLHRLSNVIELRRAA